MLSSLPANSPYPVQHAFVVCLEANPVLKPEGLAGQVEHVASGQSAHFHSIMALFAFVVEILQPPQAPTHQDT